MILLGYFLEAGLSAAAYGMIFFAWWRFLGTRRNRGESGESFPLLFAATLMWTQIFGVVLLLGLLGLLDRSVVLAANAGVTILVLGFTQQQPRRPPALWAVIRRRAGEILGEKPRDPLLLSLVGVCGIAVTWFSILNIALPAGGYDDFVFHIPTAAFYLQQHSVSMVAVAPVQDGINSAAKLGELFSVFQFSLFGNDRLVHFWAIPMIVHYLLSVYVLCRQLGAGTRNALFGSILSAFSPALLCQTLTSYNDLPTAVLFATALSFSVNRERGRAQRFAAALSCGLLLSSKHSAVLLCGIALACFVAAEAQANPVEWLKALKAGTAIGLSALVLGGIWLMRNASEYRNPFYPFEAKIAGIHLPGPITNRDEMRLLNRELAELPLPVRLWRIWREEKSHFGLWFYNYDAAYCGFGPLFFILGIPSLVASLGISALDRRWPAFSVLILTACAYLGFAGNISARLSLFVMPVIGLGIATVLTSMERDWPWNRFGTLRVGLKAGGCVLAYFTFLTVGSAPVAPQTLRAQLFTAPRDKDSIDGTFLNAFARVRRAIPGGAVVAYDDQTGFLWPLWRPDWKNEVHFVTTAGGWTRWCSDAARLRVTHVVAGLQPSSMKSWVEQYPDKFKLVAEDGFGVLYAYRE